MNTQEIIYIGIDVSKDKLDAHCSQWGHLKQFANHEKGLKELSGAILGFGENVHLVCEATGGYEKKLLCHAFANQIRISRVNARQVRDFARAKGKLAKTDKLDAEIIGEFAAVFTPAPTSAPDPVQDQLSAVIRRRDSLVRQLAREKVALSKSDNPFVRKGIQASIQFLTRHVSNCEAELKRLISSDPLMKQKQQRIEQVKGVGFGVSSLILAEVPELGKISDKQAASLIGLAPMNRDSGAWRGTRTVQGGRGLVRRGLYMPALSAASHNSILKEFYQNLRSKGKTHNVALTAVMRKLVCLINRILADSNFQPS